MRKDIENFTNIVNKNINKPKFKKRFITVKFECERSLKELL